MMLLFHRLIIGDVNDKLKNNNQDLYLEGYEITANDIVNNSTYNKIVL